MALRLASLLWRLRRALAMETGLFDIQADQIKWSEQNCRPSPSVPDPSETIFALDQSFPVQPLEKGLEIEEGPAELKKSASERSGHGTDLARCFLRLANLPNFALDRLSRYETMLSRQVAQVLFALDAFRRRNQ